MVHHFRSHECSSKLTGVWKKFISTLLDDFEKFKTSVEGGIADVVEIVREQEFEVKPEDVTELLQSHAQTWAREEFLLLDEQRKWFLEMKYASGEDAENTVEMPKNLKFHINPVDKAEAGFERIESNYKSSTMGRAWWLTPVIPGRWEAKAGGSRGQEIETVLVNMAAKPCLY